MFKILISLCFLITVGCAISPFSSSVAPVEQVLSAQEQKKLTPDMEFATKVAGAKVVLVMGHEHCEAY
jgi:hypothetical protein